MEYRAIGIMSGSSLDGLDICFAVFRESGGQWQYTIESSACIPLPDNLAKQLNESTSLTAKDYLLLHTGFGHFIGNAINDFIEKNRLQHRVQFICSHGHTTFHLPGQKMTGQIGDGAAIAAVTGITTITDLRAIDVALGGQGAPIVPVGEKLLFENYSMFLNIGGIANISAALPGSYIGYDICPANRVLNLLAAEKGRNYDAGGELAASGTLHEVPLAALNQLPFYQLPYPKSLANDFGTQVVYPLLKKFNLSTIDALRTMTEHIAIQISRNAGRLALKLPEHVSKKMLVTGGGAFNQFLISRLKKLLDPLGVEIVIPENDVVNYKEALIMALLGVLRWREEYTVLHTITGATRSSVGGCIWAG